MGGEGSAGALPPAYVSSPPPRTPTRRPPPPLDAAPAGPQRRTAHHHHPPSLLPQDFTTNLPAPPPSSAPHVKLGKEGSGRTGGGWGRPPPSAASAHARAERPRQQAKGVKTECEGQDEKGGNARGAGSRGNTQRVLAQPPCIRAVL